jgi:hypothetical protein
MTQHDYDLIDEDYYEIDPNLYAFDLDIDPQHLFGVQRTPVRIEVGGQLSELRSKALNAIRQWNDADPQHRLSISAAALWCA